MKNMNEKKSNKLVSALANLSIKTGEVATGKCMPLLSYEPKLPKELLEKK